MRVWEGPCQLCCTCLWLLPQRRKWAACGHRAKVLTGQWGSYQLFSPLSLSTLVEVELLGSEDWKAESVLLLGQSVHFPRPRLGGEACLSAVFPEVHFLWAAQEVVSEWD